tara:strand:+ start:15 stop:725 length:711 start_codon:yes stop_codon:yes gene_type:complete
MDTSMNIVMSDIDAITLNYFANKSQYNSILKKTEIGSDKQYKNDIKFYKKRILDLTKRLFRSDEEQLGDIHVNKSFTTYVKSCVNYLKFLDKSDIIQKRYEEENDVDKCESKDIMKSVGYINDTIKMDDYNSINSDNSHNSHNSDNSHNSNNENITQTIESKFENCDHLFSRPEDVKKISLDNYVIKTNEQSKAIFLPKKEEINIKTKEHKRKGIAKKKNIKNIYEDTKNETEQIK